MIGMPKFTCRCSFAYLPVVVPWSPIKDQPPQIADGSLREKDIGYIRPQIFPAFAKPHLGRLVYKLQRCSQSNGSSSLLPYHYFQLMII